MKDATIGLVSGHLVNLSHFTAAGDPAGLTKIRLIIF